MPYEYDFRGQFSCLLLAGYWITPFFWCEVGQHRVNHAQEWQVWNSILKRNFSHFKNIKGLKKKSDCTRLGQESVLIMFSEMPVDRV